MRIKNIVDEEAAGVGKITKQNTTVDVKPGETARQAAKFGNKIGKDGRPPELHKKARKNSNAHVLTNLGLGESTDIDTQGFAKQLEQKYSLKDIWISDLGSRNAIELSSIIVPKDQQGQGTGTKVMDEIVDFAEKHGRIIVLDPAIIDRKHGTTSQGRLRKFYKRFGFIENKGRNKNYEFRQLMIRYPKNRVDEVNIDNVSGRGAVPNNQEIDYFGLRIKMRPSTFLKLAAPLAGGPNDEMVDYIKQGGAIGAPFLVIDVPEDLSKDIPTVVGHEGRNRMKAVIKAEGDAPIEVHLFFTGAINRAKHLTNEIVNLLKAGAYQERTGRHVPGPLWENNGKMYGYKAMAYDPETGEIRSGADSRVTNGVKLRKGMILKMPGKGIFMSTNRDYVEQYYSGHNDYEALIKFEFNPDEITSGNLTDRENEFTVPRARVVDFKILDHLDESITEAEQKIPVSKNYNQDRGNLDWIVVQIENMIDELGEDLDILVKDVNWNQVRATQDWLDRFGGGDPVFPDVPEDFWGYPIMARVGSEFLIIDGHHRLNRDLADGERYAEGLVFDIQRKTNESKVRKPHPNQTLGVKRKDMPQVHRDHYPELIDYLNDHGNQFTMKTVHARDLKATQSEFSDKGVRKMMSTGGRPSDSMGKDKKPLIVSSDKYIIDGHHRWLAAWNQDTDVPVMQSNLPIKQLFQLVKDFKYTTYKDIHESVSGNNTYYHGTSQQSAEYIKQHGFSTSERQHGMSSRKDNISKRMTFLAKTPQTAKWYASHNSRFGSGAVIKVNWQGNPYVVKTPGGTDINGAFAQAGEENDIPTDDRGYFDVDEIVSVLQKKGYDGIQFRDRPSNNKIALVVFDPTTIVYQTHKIISEGTETLKEALKDAYPYKIFKDNAQVIRAKFTTEDYSDVRVQLAVAEIDDLFADRLEDYAGFDIRDMDLDEDDVWEFFFKRNRETELTNQGDQWRILATVIAIFREMVQKKNPKVIAYSASKHEEGGKGRLPLYRRLAKAFANESGYQVKEFDMGVEIYFFLFSPGVKLTDSWFRMEQAIMEGGHSLEDLVENADEKVCMGGGCFALAKHLHQKTGLPLYGLRDQYGNIHHAFVKKDDYGIDVRGKVPLQRMHMYKGRSSAGTEITPISMDELERNMKFTDPVSKARLDRIVRSLRTAIKENMSITGTERSRSERDKKLTPGSEAWFRHWFSRPFLKREQVEQLKQEAVNHIRGARNEKATNRRRSDRNIRTNERRGKR